MKVIGQNIPSAYADLYTTSLEAGTPRSGKSANTYNTLKYAEQSYQGGYKIRKRIPFRMPYRRGVDEVNAATLHQIETTNDYQGRVPSTGDPATGQAQKRGRPSALQLYCRNIFKKSVKCWHYQPWSGDYEPTSEQPIPKTQWFIDAAPDSAHYFNYFMGESMDGYHEGSKPLWCKGVLNYIVVADIGNYNVKGYNWKYQYNWLIPEKDNGGDDFLAPHAIRIFNGLIYVLDRDRSQIQIHNQKGEFQFKFGTQGTGVGEMLYPRAMDIAGGKIFIADTANNKVIVFTTAGVYVTEWGSEGINDGEFKDPEGIHYAFNHVYVSDYVRRDVQIFNADGTFVDSFDGGGGDGTTFDSPIGITSTATKIMVANSFGGKLFIFDPDGGNGVKFKDPAGEDVPVLASHGIMYKFGLLWFPSGTHGVYVYNLNGTLQERLGIYGDQPADLNRAISIDIIGG